MAYTTSAADLEMERVREMARAQGADHLDTISTAYDIGLMFLNQRDYFSARRFLQQVLSKRERVLGKNHPTTLSTVNSLATALAGQRLYNEALEYYQRALSGYEEVHGAHHPDTVNILKDMARLFKDNQEYDDALEYYRQALSGYEQVHGAHHSETVHILNDIAQLFKTHQKYDDALEYYRTVLSRSEVALGDEHPQTIDTLYIIASVLYKQGKYGDALKLSTQALLRQERAQGVDDSSIQSKKRLVEELRSMTEFIKSGVGASEFRYCERCCVEARQAAFGDVTDPANVSPCDVLGIRIRLSYYTSRISIRPCASCLGHRNAFLLWIYGDRDYRHHLAQAYVQPIHFELRNSPRHPHGYRYSRFPQEESLKAALKKFRRLNHRSVSALEVLAPVVLATGPEYCDTCYWKANDGFEANSQVFLCDECVQRRETFVNRTFSSLVDIHGDPFDQPRDTLSVDEILFTGELGSDAFYDAFLKIEILMDGNDPGTLTIGVIGTVVGVTGAAASIASAVYTRRALRQQNISIPLSQPPGNDIEARPGSQRTAPSPAQISSHPASQTACNPNSPDPSVAAQPSMDVTHTPEA
ncbi:hypothetical protein BDD12DRAFT_910701 [Trichophaea hybrida]|nr:hypothetical protein BDD12DRAFT_910701 [Trichophaea hybrida]